MDKLTHIWESIKWFVSDLFNGFVGFDEITGSPEKTYTAIARWVFIVIAVYVLVRAIVSLLKSKNPAEVWAYLNVNGKQSYPITHWENVIGRSKNCDFVIDDPAVSRNQGTITREDDGKWKYTDLGSKNGSSINGEKIRKSSSRYVEVGDNIVIGDTVVTIFPISLEEKRNNILMREEDTKLSEPWSSLVAITIFQLMTILQLKVSLADKFTPQITISFLGMAVIMWVYVVVLRSMRRKGFEIETIAFFLSSLSLAVTASKFPDGVLKQFIAIAVGVTLFLLMCSYLRNLERAKALRIYMYGIAAALLLFNLIFGKTLFGAANWVVIGGVSFQPSEIVKLCYIWAGAACLDELMERRNSLMFTLFSGFCFVCLAIMGDFGTAMIFFVTFLVIAFLRSGDFTKLILIVGVAFVGGLMVLKFKSYVANRFAAWGHVWQYADDAGFQQTRTMSAAASGGLVGVGAGGGWLKHIPASETDLVFGFVIEEWGLIIAILAILSIITLSIFAYKNIWAGRSAYYTIASCSAMSLFLFQTMLNVFGSVDLLPLTGVTFPFLSSGGTSMIASWGLLSFLKASDTRMNASIAVASKGIEKGDDLS